MGNCVRPSYGMSRIIFFNCKWDIPAQNLRLTYANFVCVNMADMAWNLVDSLRPYRKTIDVLSGDTMLVDLSEENEHTKDGDLVETGGWIGFIITCRVCYLKLHSIWSALFFCPIFTWLFPSKSIKVMLTSFGTSSKTGISTVPSNGTKAYLTLNRSFTTFSLLTETLHLLYSGPIVSSDVNSSSSIPWYSITLCL